MTKSILKITIPGILIVAGFCFTTMNSYAKPEYSKTTKKGCTYCHTAAGKKDLNDIGKCYAEHDHSLDACGEKK
jgi:hypothetical protein